MRRLILAIGVVLLILSVVALVLSVTIPNIMSAANPATGPPAWFLLATTITFFVGATMVTATLTVSAEAVLHWARGPAILFFAAHYLIATLKTSARGLLTITVALGQYDFEGKILGTAKETMRRLVAGLAIVLLASAIVATNTNSTIQTALAVITIVAITATVLTYVPVVRKYLHQARGPAVSSAGSANTS